MKHPLETAEAIARDLVEQLSGACGRIEIKGSIVRRRPMVGDIDIVCIPLLGEFRIPIYDMFVEGGERVLQVNHLDDALEALTQAGVWILDPELPRNGPRLKRLRHTPSGICADLAIADKRRWGMIATLRTGPADFSKALVTLASKRGKQVSEGLLHGHRASGYGPDGKALPCPLSDCCTQIISTPEEIDVFNRLGLDWLEPAARDVKAIFRHLI